MRLRESFPAAGSDYLGGASDGYEYHTTFSGSSLRKSYDMVKSFLQEEGYGDIPIITNSERLFACFVMFIASGLYGYSLN